MFLDDFSEVDEDDTILCFDEADVERTEAELRSIVDESKRNLQEMKEDALNSVWILLVFHLQCRFPRETNKVVSLVWIITTKQSLPP